MANTKKLKAGFIVRVGYSDTKLIDTVIITEMIGLKIFNGLNIRIRSVEVFEIAQIKEVIQDFKDVYPFYKLPTSC